MSMQLDYYFDLVCPWCWIGLRQLQLARQRLRASHPQLALEVNWVSYALLPHLPREGVPYQDFYLRRLGGADAPAHRRAQIQMAGQGIVPPFAFERIQTMPNTVLAHRMLDLARAQQADMPALLEDLYAAWFTEGRDIGDAGVLCELAAPHLPDSAALAAWLADDAAWAAAQRAALTPRYDITGVPALTMPGRAPLGGVTSADYLHHWLAQAAAA